MYNINIKAMKKNLGTLDRLVRLAGALAIIILYAVGQLTGTAAIILGIVALLLIATGVTGICPAYTGLKISTRNNSHRSEPA